MTMKRVSAGVAVELGGNVRITATGLPKTSGTIYALMQLDLPGDGDDGKFWDDDDDTWQTAVNVVAWPEASYQHGSFWSFALPAAATSGKAGATIVLADLTDNEATPASETTIAGGFESATVNTLAEEIWDALKADHQVSDSFGEVVQQTVASAGGFVNTPATGYVLTTGTQSSGSYSDTAAFNGTEHEHTDDAGAMELYYEFSVGGAGTPSQATIIGRINGANDSLDGIYAYNWAGASWDRIANMTGTGAATNQEISGVLFASHVGTGANLGKVRIRFYAASGLTSATLHVDQIYVSYAITGQTVGYEGGAVWIDTGSGNTNTESGVDGTADNPVSTLVAATTIATNLGLMRLHLAVGDSITLAQAYDSYLFDAHGASIDLNGQSVSGAVFRGCVIVGNDDGSNANEVHYHDCEMGDNTLGFSHLEACGFTGDMILTETGMFTFDQCYSQVAGVSTPSIDFGAAVGDSELNLRHYSGGMEIKNMGATGTDRMSLEGVGQLVINANCVGGTVAIRGNFTVTDNASGALTLSDNARYSALKLNTELEVTHGHNAGSWTGSAAGARSIDFTIDDGSVGLDGARVHVLNEAASATVTVGTTDVNGEVTISLDDATYTVRVTKSGYALADQTLVVSADAAVGYSMTAFVAPTPSDPDNCVLYGNIADIIDVAVEGVAVTLTACIPGLGNGKLMDDRQDTDTSDGSGYFQVEGIKLADAVLVGTFGGTEIFRFVKTIPDAASFDVAGWLT